MTDKENKQTHDIEQPELREPFSTERIVRVAGLKFILPCAFKAGDLLDETTAAFINSAWHTAIINRFGPQRAALLEDPKTTYDTIDAALQATYETFKVNPRQGKPPEPAESGDTEEFTALVAFGRPHFNKAMKGSGVDRKTYEDALRTWVRENTPMLREMYEANQKQISKITDAIANLAKGD